MVNNAAPEPKWIKRAADELGYAWARQAWQRAAVQPGAWFDADKADKIVELWPQIFKLTEDRFAGHPYRLIFWEEVIVRLLIGWKIPEEVLDPETGLKAFIDVRLFRRLDLWIPRKNGKSEFLAALALLFWALEGTYRGQGFVFARDESQARVVFDKMTDMVGWSKLLRKQVTRFSKSLWISACKASFKLMSGKPVGKHGRSPTVIVGDEMHEWETRDLETTLRQGTGARLQPIELYASTTGSKSAKVGLSRYEESKKIYDGLIDDPRVLVVIFAAAPEADWADEKVWAGANPSLGISPTIAFLRREAALAKGNPRAEATFRCFHLNQWVDAIVRWLPLRKWDACTADNESWKKFGKELEGRECFAACDISARQDITAWIKIFPPKKKGEKIKIVCRFWIPETTIETRARSGEGDFGKWKALVANDGNPAIETTPGDAVDQDYVKKAILQDLAKYEIKAIGFDLWNAQKLYTELEKEGVDPEMMFEIRQGIHSMGEASREFERMVFAGELDHGGHPIMRWMASHCDIRFDENLNFMPAKKKSRDRIDGIVAAVMATALMNGEQPASIDDFLNNPVMVV